MTTLPQQRQGSPAQPTPERIEVERVGVEHAGVQARPMTAQAAAPSRWSDTAFWRRWAMRLLGLWAVLSLALVAQRVATADIRPGLLTARETHQQLIEQRDTLSLEVQSLGNAGRVHQWAEEAGMLRFADSVKRSAPFAGVTPPPAAATSEPAQPPLRMGVQWGHSQTDTPADTSAAAPASVPPQTQTPEPEPTQP